MLRGALLCATLGLAACQTAPLRPLPDGDPAVGALLARWSSGVADREALRGVARLAVDAPYGAAEGGPLRVRSRQRVVLARPGRMRVEVQGMLGTTLAVLAVDEAEYAWFEAESRRFETGPVHAALLWDVVRLDLTPEEAVDVILGAPSLAGDAQVQGAWDAGSGVTRIALAEPGGTPLRSLDLDPQARLRRLARIGTNGIPAWEARYDDYAVVAGSPFARRVTIETGGGARAVVSLSDVELNPQLSPDIFRLEGFAAEGEGG